MLPQFHCTRVSTHFSLKSTPLESPWVEAEWGFFINEKRSGRKSGNLVTVVTEGLLPKELPPSLRYYEVLSLQPDSFEKLLRYVTGSRCHSS